MSYRVDFQISVDLEDDLSSAKVAIGSSKQDIAALMVATEHMMNLMAMESDAGYEKALQSLCEGARKSRRVS
jgi:hypothetical protein